MRNNGPAFFTPPSSPRLNASPTPAADTMVLLVDDISRARTLLNDHNNGFQFAKDRLKQMARDGSTEARLCLEEIARQESASKTCQV